MNFMFHTVLDAAGDVLRLYYKSSGGWKGRRRASHPGGTEEGAAFGGAKIWNLAASGKLLFVLQTTVCNILHP